MNVLLAQASKVVSNLLRRALRSSRTSVASTVEVHTASDLLRSLDGDGGSDTLIVLDWNLPGLEAPKLLAHLGRCGILDRAAVLLCVNESQVPLAEIAVGSGALGFLVRPFSDEALCAKVEELVRRRCAPAPVLPDIIALARAQEKLPSLLRLPSEILVTLFEQSAVGVHPPGSVILRPGDRVDALSFVTCGEIEVQGPDGRCTRGAGESFAEHEFICGEPAGILVRALTRVEIVAVEKEFMAGLARLHPSLREFLAALVTRRAAADPEHGESEISGTLASLAFSDLVQFLNLTRRTGVLVLEDGTMSGRITFEQGEVRDARAGDDVGEPAFLALAARPDARFSFASTSSSGSRTIHQSTLKLLMTACTPREEPEPASASSFAAKAG